MVAASELWLRQAGIGGSQAFLRSAVEASSTRVITALRTDPILSVLSGWQVGQLDLDLPPLSITDLVAGQVCNPILIPELDGDAGKYTRQVLKPGGVKNLPAGSFCYFHHLFLEFLFLGFHDAEKTAV